MERAALARAGRRRQVVDALEFEREREAMLAEQLEDVLAEADGPALDATLLTRLSDEDAALVRATLGDVEPTYDPGEGGEDGEDEEGEEREEGDDDAGVAEEAARLQGEIESSRLIQAALARYLALLEEPVQRDAG
jgi:hypothetical protein